jgi:multidrug efflux pump
MAIFLTTATTVGGLLPLALAGGPLWEGMAWLLVSGLSFATLLTLIVVPVLYSLKRA